MKLRNKKTGEIIESEYMMLVQITSTKGERNLLFKDIAELNNEWEDYEPVEPIFDERIRRGIRAWWNMQDNPFKAASVYCDKEKDLDGFYHWQIFGYIREGEQKESTDLYFRTKKLYDYNPNHDYSKEELCGDEEE